MTIEEKYRRAILALQAISQYHAGWDEWSQAEGFCDVTQCAENTLKTQLLKLISLHTNGISVT